MNYEEKLDEAIQKLHSSTESYTDSLEGYLNLKHQHKNLLADEMKRHEGSAAQREMMARSSALFVEHCNALAKTEAETLKYKAYMDASYAMVDGYRSLLSTERAKIKEL